MIVDTHTHLYDEDFSVDFDEVIQRARAAGVCKCIMPAIDIASYDPMIQTESRLAGFAYATIGLHPTSVKGDWERELDFVKGEFARRDYCAVGEIGLDGYWSRDFMENHYLAKASGTELQIDTVYVRTTKAPYTATQDDMVSDDWQTA